MSANTPLVLVYQTLVDEQLEVMTSSVRERLCYGSRTSAWSIWMWVTSWPYPLISRRRAIRVLRPILPAIPSHHSQLLLLKYWKLLQCSAHHSEDVWALLYQRMLPCQHIEYSHHHYKWDVVTCIIMRQLNIYLLDSSEIQMHSIIATCLILNYFTKRPAF